MGLVVKGVLGSSNRPGLEETAQSVGDWVGVCVWGSKYHEACEFYHASSQLALPGIKTALWRLSLTLLSLSSPRDPLCLAKHRTAYSAARETHGSVCFAIQ